MDVLPLLERACGETIEVAAKITPDDLSRPTPCPEWDVRGLLDHFLWATTFLSQAAVGQAGPEPGQDMVGAHAPTAVATTLETALDRWRSPGAMEAICHLPIGDFPGSVTVGINLVDLYTHRWDLGRALGGDTKLDDELAEAALTMARMMINDEIRATVGFAQPVPVPAAASPGDQLVAFLGRQP
jgi:uncharacterized protein (TIGR03086 family)